MERTSRNAPALLLGAALVAAATMTLVLTARMTFFQDTWEFLMNRRDISFDTVLRPHNEHLVAIPVLIEQFFLRVFGMTSALPEYILLTLFLLATSALLYVYVKRRCGPWPALFAAILILCLGPAWEVLLWPFEITFVGPIVCGLTMLLALDREDRRGDLAACALLVLALGFSGVGIAFIAAAIVAVLQGPRSTWRGRAFVFLVPLALYAAWYVGWGHDAETHTSIRNVLDSPRFVFDSIAVALGSLFGLGTDPVGGSADPVWGRAMLIALVCVLGFRQARRASFFPGLWPVVAAAAANWFLTAFNAFPGREPTSSRYQYAGAVFILLILANLLQGVRPRRRVLILGAVVTVVAIGPNLVILRDQSEVLKAQSVYTRADTAAIEISRRTVSPEFQLNPEVAGTPSLIDITAGNYLQAVEEYGSPAYSPAELASAPEEGRRQADIVLSQTLPLSTVTSVGRYGASGGGQCVVALPDGLEPSQVRLHPGPTRIEVAPGAHAAFSLRRFAEGEFPVVTEGAPGGSTTVLRIPRDANRRPWYLHVEAAQPARVCR